MIRKLWNGIKKMKNKILNVKYPFSLCLAITFFTVALKIIFPYAFENVVINICYILLNIIAGFLCAIALEKSKQADKYINKFLWILFGIIFVLSIPLLMKCVIGTILTLVLGIFFTYHLFNKIYSLIKGKDWKSIIKNVVMIATTGISFIIAIIDMFNIFYR